MSDRNRSYSERTLLKQKPQINVRIPAINHKYRQGATWFTDHADKTSSTTKAKPLDYAELNSSHNRYLYTIVKPNFEEQPNQPRTMRHQDLEKKQVASKEFTQYDTEYRDHILKPQQSLPLIQRKLISEKHAILANVGTDKSLENLGFVTKNQSAINFETPHTTQSLGTTSTKNQNQNLQNSQVHDEYFTSNPTIKKENKNPEIDSLVENNQAYFRHLKGECPCVQDETGLLKCKFKHVNLKPNIKGKIQSSYQIEFNNKNISPESLINTEKIYSTRKYEGDLITKQSLHQQDYKGIFEPAEPQKRRIVEFNPQKIERNQYRRQYLNWGQTEMEKIKWSQNDKITTHPRQEISLNAKSTAQKDFIPLKNDPQFDKIPNRNWICAQPLYDYQISDTTNRKNYAGEKPLEVLEKQVTQPSLNNQDYGIYKGMINSTSRKEIKEPEKRQLNCEQDFRGIYDHSKYMDVNKTGRSETVQ